MASSSFPARRHAAEVPMKPCQQSWIVVPVPPKTDKTIILSCQELLITGVTQVTQVGWCHIQAPKVKYDAGNSDIMEMSQLWSCRCAAGGTKTWWSVWIAIIGRVCDCEDQDDDSLSLRVAWSPPYLETISESLQHFSCKKQLFKVVVFVGIIVIVNIVRWYLVSSGLYFIISCTESISDSRIWRYPFSISFPFPIC